MITGFSAAAIIYLTDTRIKKYMEQHPELFDTEKQQHTWYRFRVFHNRGIAGGFFSGRTDQIEGGTLCVLLLLWSYGFLRRKREKSLIRELAIGLLSGGGLNNWLDRRKNGAVTDYLMLPFLPGTLGRLVYNLSDLAIFAGAVLLALAEKDEIDEKNC